MRITCKKVTFERYQAECEVCLEDGPHGFDRSDALKKAMAHYWAVVDGRTLCPDCFDKTEAK